MSKKSNYTMKELIMETGKEITASEVYQDIKGGVKSFYQGASFLYRIPGFYNDYIKDIDSEWNHKFSGTTFVLGLMGSTILSLSAIGYYGNSIKEHPYIAALPLATNAVSGLYQIVKKAKKNLEERTTENNERGE